MNETRYKNILSEKVRYIGFEGNGGVKRKGTRDWRYDKHNVPIFSNINLMLFYKGAKYRKCLSYLQSLVPFLFTPPLPSNH